MNKTISNDLLARLSQLIDAQMGLHFPPKNWRNLERGLGLAAPAFGFEDVEAFGRWLLATPLTQDQIHQLACHLTIGETYFFRDIKTFEVLQQHVLAEILFSRKAGERRLRIWSAGCASGEEAYSIAILLTRSIPDISQWNITILATDVNPQSLRKAEEGVYTGWSFRNPPPWLQTHYFKQIGKQFEILPHIKRMVTFSMLNLAEDVYPSLANNTNAMDIIFCRNVMMYFSETLRKKLIQNFHHALVDGGWLLVSPSEAYSPLFPQYVTVNFPGSIFFLKDPQPKDLQQVWFARTFGFNEKAGDVRGNPGSADVPSAPYAGKMPALLGPKSPAFPSISALAEQEREFPSWEGQGVGNTMPKHGETLKPTPTPSQEGNLAALPRKNLPLKGTISPCEEAARLYKQGQYQEAIEQLLTSATAATNEQATELLTRAYANQGNFEKALEWGEKAIAINKLNPGLHYLRATILQEQNRFAEAVESFRRALYLDPNFVLAYFALGNIARQQGKFNESQKHFENVRRLLHAAPPDEVLPESDGITAGRLRDIVTTMLN